jgi:hypothetical protein
VKDKEKDGVYDKPRDDLFRIIELTIPLCQEMNLNCTHSCNKILMELFPLMPVITNIDITICFFALSSISLTLSLMVPSLIRQ